MLGAALAASGCGGEGATGREGADLGRGKELFVSGCGGCHTLADAGTQGRTGPNLDHAFGYAREQEFDSSSFYDITLQQIDIPAPPMPGDIYKGQDAVDVAAYVAEVAGVDEATLRGSGQAAAGGETGAAEEEGGEGGGAEEGKEVFAAAGCGSCHTLADAGASGTIGPNLDESQPSKDLAVERVTNGQGVMPPFRDQLTEAQIDAVAEYVSTAAGR